ncbi:anticodon nuclease [Ornithobacterium rhinotracheale]|uniref:Anticodon nuclease n=1 Tax=Ornithobacterium rhinotracheale TaxID=28251 RepID=A0A3R5UYL6_ORNRH|nr:AAA family ATPase [Ornithobacterium rhinotracheale]QAR31509.1 anticodon nuclease [Ornithobacterium rhinotracheale]
MEKNLNNIAQQLMMPIVTQKAQNSKKEQKAVPKVQLIYAFNGTGKTRLSMELKKLVATGSDDDSSLTRHKFLYYNAFTEDLFYWDNDLEGNKNRVLKIQPNSFTDWILQEQGQDQNIISHFQRYTNDKLTPKFNAEYLKNPQDPNSVVKANSEVTFSLERGNDEEEDLSNIKISKGEESNFIWCVFYSLLHLVIEQLNIPEHTDRETDQFNELEYIFIDDPVSSLDENYLIEMAIDIAKLIKSSESDLKFIITTHNPLFYNVLYNELNRSKRYILRKYESGGYELLEQKNDSPFAFHLFLKSEIERALSNDELQKYHFNYLRNILEKTATFLGYEKWGELLPKDPDGSNPTETRIINLSSHSQHSTEEVSMLIERNKAVIGNLIKLLNETYKFKS